jgi:hypothetical protein
MDRDMRRAPTSKTRRASPLVAFFALSCAVAVAACGSSSKPTTAASTSYAQALKYTVCLRSHGVPNFPDPGPEGGIAPITPGSGINPQSPAFQSAQQACAKLNPIAATSPRSYTASQKRTALEHAECMRQHGVPGYPDPTYGRYGSANRPIAKPLPSNINPQAPAFTNAEKACERT